LYNTFLGGLHHGLIGLIGLVGLIGLIGHISLVGHNGHLDIECTRHTGLIGLLNCVGHNDRIGLVSLDLSYIGRNILIGNVIFVSLGLVAVSLGNIRIYFEIKTKLSPCYLLARESWLWCARRVFSSLAGLNSVYGDALQNATQLFFNRIPQMNKYFVTRECEHIGHISISSKE
jgi:hypothetical protein